MSFKILMGIAGVIGVFQFFRLHDKFTKLILLSQIIAIAASFMGNSSSLKISVYLIGLGALSIFIKTLIEKESFSYKLSIIFTSGSVLTQLIFKENSWPHGVFIPILLFLGFSSFIYFLIAHKQKRNEISSTFILAFHSLTMLLIYSGWAFLNDSPA